ncbi:hypothetical protein INS49_006362 [Diaporthe citri]|uniref:uncharacterized protein n=1 Tax=Diaporthe citri TaxID=83186 RepID=UPI001C8139F6|nr:uncharacterized protein INS49_006362 [Diaporthe citri]KAG6364758.1 hypothetical protein INS49_006362 [Diaporthe citri]
MEYNRWSYALSPIGATTKPHLVVNVALAITLDDVCTSSYVAAHLPASGYYGDYAISVNADSVTANPVTNYTVGPVDSPMFPAANFDHCNVTFTYSHDGRGDAVLLTFWLPAPHAFQNRYLATGGGGYAINSRLGSLPGGVMYGAVASQTDGGFGQYQTDALSTFLIQNGTIHWQNVYMFGYQAIREQSLLGREFSRLFFNLTETDKLYKYYQGCSEGGREGWSQAQRFEDAYDGAVIGAPAFRFAFQQVQHLYANVVEQTMGYFPPPCELQKIMNETIVACDPLDGKADGVVARRDLCTANYNINATLGLPYSCAAAPAGPFTSATPAQNGTVSAQGIALAQKTLEGLHDDDGKRAYFSYTPSSSFTDAQTVLLNLEEGENLANLDNVTYSTLRDWIWKGWNRYNDVLMTNWPDISPLKNSGAKILHYHGESDFSISTASSVRYYEPVRSILNPGATYNESIEAMNDFYKLFLVPGGAHCNYNPYEPNGPWPQTNLALLIDWVENGNEPLTLNATILQGENLGQSQQICAWPLRPLWANNGTSLECVYDQSSIDSWKYDLDAFPMPVY